ncbi:MAG: hypothetical protein ACLVBB_02550 [Dysosmobacter welbionis]
MWIWTNSAELTIASELTYYDQVEAIPGNSAGGQSSCPRAGRSEGADSIRLHL